MLPASPLQFFAPDELEPQVPSNGYLADAFDPSTGELLSIARGTDPTDAAVLAALTIQRGTGTAVANAGNNFGSIEFVDDQLPTLLDAEVRFALASLIDAGDIELRSVTSTTEDTAAMVDVRYYNRARGEERRTLIPVNTLLGVA